MSTHVSVKALCIKKKEEQRRLEILAGHWDLPVTEITPAR
jgi:hypothetical protein